jgi:lipid A 3-O-deacylase
MNTYINMNNLCILVRSVLAGVLLAQSAQALESGFSIGHGRPHNLNSYRLHLAGQEKTWHVGQQVSPSFTYTWEWSISMLQLQHQHSWSYLSALGPRLRWLLPARGSSAADHMAFLQLGIGLTYRNCYQLGDVTTKSRWKLQDTLGFGVVLQQRWELSVHYVHYSNAGISQPNPGIDLIPMLTVAYHW